MMQKNILYAKVASTTLFRSLFRDSHKIPGDSIAKKVGRDYLLQPFYRKLNATPLNRNEKKWIKQELNAFCIEFDLTDTMAGRIELMAALTSKTRSHAKILEANIIEPTERAYLEAKLLEIQILSVFDCFKPYQWRVKGLNAQREDAYAAYLELSRAVSSAFPHSKSKWNDKMFKLREEFCQIFANEIAFSHKPLDLERLGELTWGDVGDAVSNLADSWDNFMLEKFQQTKKDVELLEDFLFDNEKLDDYKQGLVPQSISDLISKWQDERPAGESELRFASDPHDIQLVTHLVILRDKAVKMDRETSNYITALKRAKYQDDFIKNLTSDYISLSPRIKQIITKFDEIVPNSYS